jgi:hypothetical protein
MLDLDLLGIFLAHRVFIGLDMTFVGTPAIGLIAGDAKRL